MEIVAKNNSFPYKVSMQKSNKEDILDYGSSVSATDTFP